MFLLGEVVRAIGGGANMIVRRVEGRVVVCEPFDGGAWVEFKAHELKSLSKETLESRPH